MKVKMCVNEQTWMLLLFLNLTALLFLIRQRQTRAKVPVPIVLSISRSSYLSESSPGGVAVWVLRGGGGAEEEDELPLRPKAAKWLVIPTGRVKKYTQVPL